MWHNAIQAAKRALQVHSEVSLKTDVSSQYFQNKSQRDAKLLELLRVVEIADCGV